MSNQTKNLNQNLDQNNQKPFLSPLTAKIILAIIIFAGSVIIIISGAKFIIEYYKTQNFQANNQIVKPDNQQSQNYYDILEKKCGDVYDSCCLSSLDIMRQGGYKEADENGNCPDGFEKNMQKCITTFQWCEPIKENCAKEGETIGAGMPKICCQGLKVVGGWPGGYDGDCSLPAPPTGLSICSDCGDGNCNIKTGENKCNCPEDCGDKINTSDWQTYQNEEYGFEVKYPKDNIKIKQIDDTFYIAYSNFGDITEQGQFVRIFTKNNKDSLKQAIEKKFLENYSKEDCFLLENKDLNKYLENKYDKYPESYILMPAISYPKDKYSESQNNPWFNKCPRVYSQSNGISYFLMDNNHPDKFVFFSIGQYSISAPLEDVEIFWQDTFRFID